uniref:Glucagon / GIP / secretin / VIP family domain-containing protein n=1 Tax=Acanthochromis polyacanthus TaxID=80966 RepID=A0A3Q1EKW2_9TELE
MLAGWDFSSFRTFVSLSFHSFSVTIFTGKNNVVKFQICDMIRRTDQLIDCAWHSYRMEKGQRIIRSFKRHSDGTFTNDFTRYLDKMKAKDFVEWLASTKREG